ncbi:MAG: hypothetical protein V5A44_05380 [Haloarculaceae archaeon]
MNSQGRAQARRLAVMAVAAVMLATAVAASLGGGPAREDPRASFTFDVENDTVLVRHYGGDVVDGSDLAVKTSERGRLGTFDGSDGMACESNVSRVGPGSVCRVSGVAHERLLVVWEGPDDRSLILARRGPDPTATTAPTTRPLTATPSPARTPTSVPAGTTAIATATPTPEERTGTPTATTVLTPTGTPTATLSPTPTNATTDATASGERMATGVTGE